MNKQLEYFDEQTEKQYILNVEFQFDRYSWGDNADGDFGQERWDIDWTINSVEFAGKVIKPELGLKKRIVDFVDKYVDKSGDFLLESYQGRY